MIKNVILNKSKNTKKIISQYIINFSVFLFFENKK